jgi:hypothetical protein
MMLGSYTSSRKKSFRNEPRSAVMVASKFTTILIGIAISIIVLIAKKVALILIHFYDKDCVFWHRWYLVDGDHRHSNSHCG